MRTANFLFLFLFPSTLLTACGGATAATSTVDASAPDGETAVPAPFCASGKTTCDGACTDLASNQDNCGACGLACQPMERCQHGACTFIGCDPNLVVCDGICNTFDDPKTCGSCATACPTGQVCSLQKCTTACAAGLTTCDGACANLAIDKYNCGACGKTCDLSCVAGKCTSDCPAGWKSCVAGCRDIANDRLHCGICGNECAAGESCAQGKCVKGS